jgi:CRISPR-associated protein Csb1
VHADGAVDPLEIDRSVAHQLYAKALEEARADGFDLAAEPIRLTPQDKLVEIVRKSQALALEGEGGEADQAP